MRDLWCSLFQFLASSSFNPNSLKHSIFIKLCRDNPHSKMNKGRHHSINDYKRVIISHKVMIFSSTLLRRISITKIRDVQARLQRLLKPKRASTTIPLRKLVLVTTPSPSISKWCLSKRRETKSSKPLGKRDKKEARMKKPRWSLEVSRSLLLLTLERAPRTSYKYLKRNINPYQSHSSKKILREIW